MKKTLAELKKDILFNVTLRGRPFIFATTWGLFSPEKIDDGSYLLIENAKIGPHDRVLDVGCGYGAIGIALAPSTDNEVHMTDKDYIAIEYAEKNAKNNKIVNSFSYLSNGFDRVQGKFDAIVSNLPAKVSKEMYWILFEEAHEHLNAGGVFYVVVIAGLKEFIKRNFTNIFGNFEKVAHTNNHMVAKAVRT